MKFEFPWGAFGFLVMMYLNFYIGAAEKYGATVAKRNVRQLIPFSLLFLLIDSLKFYNVDPTYSQTALLIIRFLFAIAAIFISLYQRQTLGVLLLIPFSLLFLLIDSLKFYNVEFPIILFLFTIAATLYQRQTLGALLLKFEEYYPTKIIKALDLESLPKIVSWIVMGFLWFASLGLLLTLVLTNSNIYVFVFLFFIVTCLFLIGIFLAHLPISSLSTVEFKENGIWIGGAVLKWKKLRSYKWEPTKPNVLTICHRSVVHSLFTWQLLNWTSILIPEEHRNAVMEILSEHSPMARSSVNSSHS